MTIKVNIKFRFDRIKFENSESVKCKIENNFFNKLKYERIVVVGANKISIYDQVYILSNYDCKN